MSKLHSICQLKGAKTEAKLRLIIDKISNHPNTVNNRDDQGRTPFSYFLENCDSLDQSLEPVVLETINMFLNRMDLGMSGNSIIYYTRFTKTFKIGDLLLRYYVQDYVCDRIDPMTLTSTGTYVGSVDDTIPTHIIFRLLNNMKNKIQELEKQIEIWNDMF